jgi:hypothetical protein
MEKLKLESFAIAVAVLMSGGSAYSQTYNAPNQIPAQNVPYQYRTPAPAQGKSPRNPPAPVVPVVDYSRPPLMNQQAYDEASGYKTPNTYSLYSQRPPQPMGAYANNGRGPVEEDKGVEYYMSLAYGMMTYDGEGIGNSYTDYPMNNAKTSLGDGKSFAFGLGAVSTTDVRVEVAYTILSGLSYGPVMTALNQTDLGGSDGYGNFGAATERLPVSGGGISSQSIGVNVYLPMDDMFGLFLDGLARPYIGGGIGMAFNTLEDYKVTDEYGYGYTPLDTSGQPQTEAGDELYGMYEYGGTVTHFGSTTNSMSWNIEAGLEMRLDKKTKIDVYYKKQSFGTVQSKDYIVSSYSSMLIVDPVWDGTAWTCAENFDLVDDGAWCGYDMGGPADTTVSGLAEKGKIENSELGVRLRMMF